jgi:hypothetical protein
MNVCFPLSLLTFIFKSVYLCSVTSGHQRWGTECWRFNCWTDLRCWPEVFLAMENLLLVIAMEVINSISFIGGQVTRVELVQGDRSLGLSLCLRPCQEQQYLSAIVLVSVHERLHIKLCFSLNHPEQWSILSLVNLPCYLFWRCRIHMCG